MKKQVTMVDHDQMIRNIVSVYCDADETQRAEGLLWYSDCLLYTSPSPRD